MFFGALILFGSFISDGYKQGDIIKITGTTANDGYKNISGITPTVITTIEPLATEPIYTSSATISPSATFVSNRYHQAYYVPSASTALFSVGDYLNIYFNVINSITGTTVWEHSGPAGETWVVTGTTTNQIPWQVTGTTTSDGTSTGTTTWQVVDYNPILKYQAQIIDIENDYVEVERKLEDYVYNNMMSLAADTNYSLFYTLESLEFADKSYFGIEYILEETKWADYFSVTATTNQITIQPIPNEEDLYFDYDNVQIILFMTGATEAYYKFNTNRLYTKYKLDRFLSQFNYDTGTTVYYNNSAITSSDLYNGELEFDIELTNSGDTQYFSPYTYIYATGNTNTQHICLILRISGTTFTILTPRINMSIGETIISINNMYTIYDISRMLYECYINIESGNAINDDYYVGGPNEVIDPLLIGLNVVDPRDTHHVLPDPVDDPTGTNWLHVFEPGTTS